MRKLTIGLVAFFVLLATALSATAAPAVHKVTGGGWFVPYEGSEKITQSFTAQIDADGNVKGQMQVQERPWWDAYHVDVNYLEVNGNEAVIGGEVTKAPNQPGIVGQEVYVHVVDNGEGNDAVDQISITDIGTYYGLYPFNGNIQVS